MGVPLAACREVDSCVVSLLEDSKMLTVASMSMRKFLPLLWQVMNISLTAALRGMKENTTGNFPHFSVSQRAGAGKLSFSGFPAKGVVIVAVFTSMPAGSWAVILKPHPWRSLC